MYEFAILALGGALTLKTVDFLGHILPEMHKMISTLVSAGVGVAYAYLFNYSVFAGWGITVRSAELGLIGTGLFMWAMSDVWRESVSVLHEWAHRYKGEATAYEAKISRVA